VYADGKKYWDVVHKYVESFIAIFFKDKSALVADAGGTP